MKLTEKQLERKEAIDLVVRKKELLELIYIHGKEYTSLQKEEILKEVRKINAQLKILKKEKARNMLEEKSKERGMKL